MTGTRDVRRVVAGTANRGKIVEIAQILAALGIETMDLDSFPPLHEIEENGSTFAENARIKATAIAAATNEFVIADDSGLEVDALGGAPGVRSARFAGPACDTAVNNALLLEKLASVPEENRTARFRCAVCLAGPDGVVAEAEGATEGVILREPRGFGGFGYDPLFLSTDLGLTFAEAPSDAKNRVSHRGRALSRLVEKMRSA